MPVGTAARLTDTLRRAGSVFAEEEAALLITEAGSEAELDAMVARRVDGLPLEQVLGWADFRGLPLAVEPGVFVPRRRTGLLVDETKAPLSEYDGRIPVVVDMCCGVGAVGAALYTELGSLELHAVDVDRGAVRCTRRNLDGTGTVYEGDLYAPLPLSLRGRVDAIVANAPYVPTDAIATMPPEAREHEALVALDGGADGTDIQLRVAAESTQWLAPGGHLLIETSRDQASRTRKLVVDAGLDATVTWDDELDGTAVVGTRR